MRKAEVWGVPQLQPELAQTTWKAVFFLFQARSGKLQPCLHHSGIKPQLVQDCSTDVITRGPRSPEIRGGTHSQGTFQVFASAPSSFATVRTQQKHKASPRIQTHIPMRPESASRDTRGLTCRTVSWRVRWWTFSDLYQQWPLLFSPKPNNSHVLVETGFY